jgi:amidophosphoribosyltransferase
MLKEAGAKEVHIRVSSPPFKWPCFFGTDIPSKKELIACKFTKDDICKKLEADSLGYLSVKSLMKITGNNKCSSCNGCFTGKYPMEVPEEIDKMTLEKEELSRC